MFNESLARTSGLSYLAEAACITSKYVDKTTLQIETPRNGQSVSVNGGDRFNRTAMPQPRFKREIFPQKLKRILNNKALSYIISWIPNGKAFVIIRPEIFINEVVPQYFSPGDARACTELSSFTRKMNSWGFLQVTGNRNIMGFYHPLFHRGQPHLCAEMVCLSGVKHNVAKVRRNLYPKKRSWDGLGNSRSGAFPKAHSAINVIDSAAGGGNYSVVSRKDGTDRIGAIESRSGYANTISTNESVPVPGRASVSNSLVIHVTQFSPKDKESPQDNGIRNDQEIRMQAAHTMLYRSFIKALHS